MAFREDYAGQVGEQKISTRILFSVLPAEHKDEFQEGFIDLYFVQTLPIVLLLNQH